MGKSKIGLVVHDFDRRFGHGRYAVELATRLIDGYEFHIFSNTFDEDPREGWVFHRVPAYRRRALSSILTFSLTVDSMIAKVGCDLVHSQGLCSWRADLITAHICVAKMIRQIPNQSPKEHLSRRVMASAEKFFYDRNPQAAVVAVSKSVQEDLLRDYGSRHRTDVVYHGVDAETFCPAGTQGERQRLRSRYGIDESRTTWLFIGEASKGLEEALQLLAEHPEASLLVISRSSCEPYERRAVGLGVRDRFHFYGFESEVQDVYKAVDILVYPSRYDSFGMVVTEAMAAGVPVIVDSRIGASEIIESGRSGFVVDFDDLENVSNILRRLHDDRECRMAVGSEARRKAMEHSWSYCAERTGEIYERELCRLK